MSYNAKDDSHTKQSPSPECPHANSLETDMLCSKATHGKVEVLGGKGVACLRDVSFRDGERENLEVIWGCINGT